MKRINRVGQQQEKTPRNKPLPRSNTFSGTRHPQLAVQPQRTPAAHSCGVQFIARPQGCGHKSRTVLSRAKQGESAGAIPVRGRPSTDNVGMRRLDRSRRQAGRAGRCTARKEHQRERKTVDSLDGRPDETAVRVGLGRVRPSDASPAGPYRPSINQSARISFPHPPRIGLPSRPTLFGYASDDDSMGRKVAGRFLDGPPGDGATPESRQGLRGCLSKRFRSLASDTVPRV